MLASKLGKKMFRPKISISEERKRLLNRYLELVCQYDRAECLRILRLEGHDEVNLRRLFREPKPQKAADKDPNRTKRKYTKGVKDIVPEERLQELIKSYWIERGLL